MSNHSRRVTGSTGARHSVQSSERERLSFEREQFLAREARDHGNDAARDELLLAHDSMAQGAAFRAAGSTGLSQEDLLQVGRLALANALKSFDPDRGFRFSTHARHSMHGAVSRYVMDNYSCVRVGTTEQDRTMFTDFRYQRLLIEKETGRPLDHDGRVRLAAYFGVSLTQLQNMETILSGPAAVSAIADGGNAGDNEDRCNALTVEARSDQVDSRLSLDKLKVALAELIAELPDRERIIITERRLAETPAKLSDIGQRLRLTKERVRQLESKAVIALQRGMRKRGFRPSDLPIAA